MGKFQHPTGSRVPIYQAAVLVHNTIVPSHKDNMNIKTSFYAAFSVAASLLLLTSCASLEQGIHNQLQSMEDSFRGYRVQYHTLPAGAKIQCEGKQLGVAPFYKYRDLTEQQKSNQILEIEGCEALWDSGARADIQGSIPLDRFPYFVHLVIERPADAPNFEIDEAVGVKTLAARQKLLDDIAAMGGGIAALAEGIRDSRKASNTGSGVTSMPSLTAFHSVSSAGGIRWNWVQASTVQMPTIQPSLGIQKNNTNHVTFTPVVTVQRELPKQL
jgi:hypothetical protein